MTNIPKPPAPGVGKPVITLPSKVKSGFDPASLKEKGPGPKRPAPGKRMSLPGKARGR